MKPNHSQTRALPITTARANADPRERRRSALLGVNYAQGMSDNSLDHHKSIRRNLREAIVAARDEGAAVREIAEQMNVSRNAVYGMMRRAQGK
jgi:Mor family transcriptional regulator